MLTSIVGPWPGRDSASWRALLSRSSKPSPRWAITSTPFGSQDRCSPSHATTRRRAGAAMTVSSVSRSAAWARGCGLRWRELGRERRRDREPGLDLAGHGGLGHDDERALVCGHGHVHEAKTLAMSATALSAPSGVPVTLDRPVLRW